MDKIAIIGMSCLFPGAESPDQLIRNLQNEKDSLSTVGKERIQADPDYFYTQKKGVADTFYNTRGGYITDFQFDPKGFAVPEKELLQSDDLCKWSLYVAREAIKDAGYESHKEKLARCGIVLGNLSFPTKQSNRLFLPLYHRTIDAAVAKRLGPDAPEIALDASEDRRFADGRMTDRPPFLISRALSLSGPVFSLDAACATSLYAIKFAGDYLLSGKCDLMLAGAVSGADPFFINMGFSIFQAFPLKGGSSPLDRYTEGLLAGEGAAMVVLKRYADAVRDRNRIYAIVDGIGLSNDGRGKFVLVPKMEGQLLAMKRAYGKAETSPDRIDYLECHATGTPVGDATELQSIDAMWKECSRSPLVGSIKSNFGHTLTAAGMASLLKIVLGMERGVIPATIHIDAPVSSPKETVSPKTIVRKATPWPTRPGDKAAAINAFGFGGTNAHMVVRQKNRCSSAPKREKRSKPDTDFRMAIIGMEAIFGNGNGLQELAYNIYTKNQKRRQVPKNRWRGVDRQERVLRFYGVESAEILRGSYLDAYEVDFSRFKIPPNDIEKLLPQQLLMLEVADRAIFDAGLKSGRNVGVIVAMGSDPSLHRFRGRIELPVKVKRALKRASISLSREELSELVDTLKNAVHETVDINEFTSYIGNIMASRISALWDFTGPSFTVSAEENSFFRAVEIARMMLESKEAEAVVVGAVDLCGSAEEVLIRHRYGKKLDTKGGSSIYSSNNDGWSVGEGAGAIVLTAAEEVQKGGKRIYAFFESLTMRPGKSTEELQDVCNVALDRSGNQPQDIGYVEINDGISADRTHATAISNLYSQSGDTASAIGSTAANFGHTFAASGAAALIKAVLCLHHRFLPAIPNWETLRFPAIAKETNLYAPHHSHTWFPDGLEPRRAAISSLDSNGILAHAVVAEGARPGKHRGFYLEQCDLRLFLVKANEIEGIRLKIARLQDLLARSDSFKTAAEVWHHSQLEEEDTRYCLALLGKNRADLLQEMDSAVRGVKKAVLESGEWESPSGSYFASRPLAPAGKIAFVYPGGFVSYPGMQTDLFQLFPDLEPYFDGIGGMDRGIHWNRLIFPRSLRKKEEMEKELLQKEPVAMFESAIAFSMLYTAMLKGAFGLRPDIALGYCMGEVSMLLSLNVWRDVGLFRKKLLGRGKTVRKAWKTFSVRAPASVVKSEIADCKRLYLTAVNSPKEVVIAGESEACSSFLAQQSYKFTELPQKDAIHCDPARAEFELLKEMHRHPVSAVSDISFVTDTDGESFPFDSESLANRMAERFCSRFDFPNLVRRAYEKGASIFVEMGPQNSCGRWISETLETKPHLALSLDRKGQNDHHTLLRALAKLASHKVAVEWSPLFGRHPSAPAKSKTVRTISLGGEGIAAKIEKSGIANLLKSIKSEPKAELKPPTLQDTDTVAFPQNGLDYHRTRMHSMQKTFLDQRKETLHLLREAICAQISETKRQPPLAGEMDAGTSYANRGENRTGTRKKEIGVLWDENDLLEFADGKIANVFGKEYAAIDSYRCRVRLPLPPYLLVSRVTQLDAVKGRFEPSSITTEYDIPHNSWFCVDRQIPWAVAVESGQCDLFLISYLGIDFRCRGERVYRLLDCTLTFVDRMPLEGDVLRYEIAIDSFVQQGDILLFFFRYDCFVGSRPILQMRGGCAGFFSFEELSKGKGVILSQKERKERSRIEKGSFFPPLSPTKASFSRAELLLLTKGRVEECFGSGYAPVSPNPSLRLSTERMLMHDRILSVETQGGLWGLGEVMSEKDLAPDHWYFPCHFKDDQVLAGSLMAEGCVQLLQFYMLYVGLHIHTKNARFQPIRNLPNRVRCRGQAVRTDRLLTYRLEITDIGLEPHPHAKGNVDIILKQKVIVSFQDVGVELVEKR